MFVPEVIFLDAVGTLFDIQGSVGRHYAQFLANYGINISEKTLDKAFTHVFRASPQPAFGGIDSSKEVERREKEWWRQVVRETFSMTMNGDPFRDFDDCFEQLYDHFSTASAWVLYPETFSTLKRWSEQGIQLGVISNFDSRLLNVLQVLDLADFFQSVTLPGQIGVAKPNPMIFQSALENFSCAAQDALHVGDQYLDDYQGSIGAGLRGIWLRRENHGEITESSTQLIESLDQLSFPR